jgi:hypothetical protein
MTVCNTLRSATRNVTRAKLEDAVSRVFVAAQVYNGVNVAGWEHLSKVSRGDAGSRVQAMLEWDVEVLEKVFVQMQQSDDLKAVDSKISAHLNRVVCVSECANMKAYLEVVGITM